MNSRILFSLILSVICLAAHAQVYKWVDADGKVTYSDVPPPKSAVKVEAKSFSDSAASNVQLPFELAEAVKNMPVTLYTTSKCPPCDEGRSFLKQSHIPFSEKTVTTEADFQKLSSITDGNQFPLLTVGRTKLKGYLYSDWHSTLSQAGYPDTNMLPSDYQYPAPQPAAPSVTNAADTPKPASQTDLPQRDPNGFQF